MDAAIIWRWAADLVLVAHGVFVLFVVAGGWLVLRRPRLAWLHLPASAWGAAIEFTGGICPLTPLEDRLRRRAGEAGLPGGFIEHYLLAALYPSGLTRELQWLLGAAVVVVNGCLYGWMLHRRARARRRAADPAMTAPGSRDPRSPRSPSEP